VPQAGGKRDRALHCIVKCQLRSSCSALASVKTDLGVATDLRLNEVDAEHADRKQLTLQNPVQHADALPTCLRLFSCLFPRKKRWTCLLEGTPSLLSISIHGRSCPDGRLSAYVPVRWPVSSGGEMGTCQKMMSKRTRTRTPC